MDRFIESELHNAIFYDPKFIQRFLSGDAAKLEQVHEECGRLNEYYREYDIWQLPSKITTEKSLYEPLLKIFNTIKKAVDAVDAVDAADASIHTDPSSRDHEETNSNPPSSDNDQSGNFVPSKKLDRTSKSAMPSTRSTRSNTGLTNTSKPPMPTKPSKPSFIDNSKYSIPSDRAETELIKPDLVLFEVEEKHKHWEHVRLPIEIKKQPGHQKAAMKQLSRYARAVFAHQLHRRHLYAMMVCGTEATFVRFDRAGILYSGPLDLRKKSKAFTDALASLLLLNKTDQGYDPAFTCKMNEQGRLVYFVDLPASAFANQEPTTESTTSNENKIRRFEVAERLCHRRSICGRATIVLRIGKKDSGEEYILKIMWRDPERDSEGEVLRQVKGTFGLAQYVWHGDACGNCRCASQATRPWGCSECVARTVQLEELEICEQMTDIAIPVPPEVEGGDEVELMVVDTTSHRPTSRRRPHRICAFLVISSRGAPLQQAETAEQFMRAVLDAILGT
ncbi:unnamed protein product [Rhizoctonia solani]|uniref:Fungal-type protein kinase domain-containing protein n=1 Tax=Rhizoctonia solani TaxID=456999 RepID=A0A8H3E769_9AGAM|nr:unnamed protein product [Rhizoctonia solani]